ncbi:MAG: HAD-IB family hydrolase [Chloroflexota bacterium]
MRAAFFDVDGTLTQTRVWNGLMDYFRVNGQRKFVNAVFKIFHYFLYFLHRIKLLSQVRFREVWAKNLSWYLRGYSLQQAAKIWDWVVENRIAGQWRPEIVIKLKEHLSAGDLVFLVSGGPEGLLRRIADELGVDHVVGTRHVVVAGVYSGAQPAQACQGENKVILVKKREAELGIEIDYQTSYAYADSLGDLDLLEMVGNPVAVYPDQALKPIALSRNWPIVGD